jgi:uncharacterized protein
MPRPANKFVWFDLVTSDLESATEFYRSVVGWNIRDAMMPGRNYSVISMGSTMVGGLTSQGEQVSANGPSWLGYIGVDDLDESAAHTVKAGGKILKAAEEIPGVGRFALAADPQGAAFILFASPGMPVPAPVKAGDLGRVAWHELHTTDTQGAFGFYSSLFGWTEAEGLADLAGTTFGVKPDELSAGGIARIDGSAARPAWLHFFNVPNLTDAVARVKQGGGTALPVKGVSGLGAVAHCVDPQGASFALIELTRA